MYAVIKTGGKQYRVSPGDLLVVEKLDGEPGAKIEFGEVLMIGDGETATLGAPLVEGGTVSATLVETRKGEKIKIFKKIRRQGYRRTRGHRQFESVLRVTAVAGDGRSEAWDGEVDLTPRAELTLRARGLSRGAAVEQATPEAIEVETVVEPEVKGKGKSRGKAPRVRAKVVETAEAAPPAKKTRGGKAPSARDVAKSGAPKTSRKQARAPAVRRTAPRGGKG